MRCPWGGCFLADFLPYIVVVLFCGGECVLELVCVIKCGVYFGVVDVGVDGEVGMAVLELLYPKGKQDVD